MTKRPPVLLLATQNAKKRRELEDIVGAQFTVQTLDDVGLGTLEIVEDGETFSANAEIKARATLSALVGDTGDIAAVLADDSGIVVDALDGAPGVRSARFAADNAAGEGDADNNRLLLQRLQGVPDDKRSARFVCHIALLRTDLDGVLRADGAVEGRIAHDEYGAGGFGYDPLFLPDEAPGKRMAELNPDEKHAISHRGRALRDIVSALTKDGTFFS